MCSTTQTQTQTASPPESERAAGALAMQVIPRWIGPAGNFFYQSLADGALSMQAQSVLRLSDVYPSSMNQTLIPIGFNHALCSAAGNTHQSPIVSIPPEWSHLALGQNNNFLKQREEPKPSHSYIGLIAMAILSSKDKKLLLSEIYEWILSNFAYFRNKGPGWRNSVRHNLSLNDCFVKVGRAANGKGHYWAIHPANLDDFIKGDFRRRKAQRKVRRHLGIVSPQECELLSPSSKDRVAEQAAEQATRHFSAPSGDCTPNVNSITVRRKSSFDIESLLAPDRKFTRLVV